MRFRSERPSNPRHPLVSPFHPDDPTGRVVSEVPLLVRSQEALFDLCFRDQKKLPVGMLDESAACYPLFLQVVCCVKENGQGKVAGNEPLLGMTFQKPKVPQGCQKTAGGL